MITVSDTRSPEDDVSGRTLSGLAPPPATGSEDAALVPDDVAAIRGAVRRLLALPGVDVVVLTGGTGFSPRDVTLDAVAPLLDKPIEGFGELFRDALLPAGRRRRDAQPRRRRPGRRPRPSSCSRAPPRRSPSPWRS